MMEALSLTPSATTSLPTACAIPLRVPPLGDLNESATGALPGMTRLSLAIIALCFALLIGAFVLTVFTF